MRLAVTTDGPSGRSSALRMSGSRKVANAHTVDHGARAVRECHDAFLADIGTRRAVV
jgi:hypothetical protein